MRSFYATSLPTQKAWTPIQFPQTVQDSAADSEASVRPKLHLFRRVEFIHRINQPDDARLNEIVKQYIPRQPNVNSARDMAHL